MNRLPGSFEQMDYFQLSKLIDGISGVSTAAEMHGMLCGELSAGVERSADKEPLADSEPAANIESAPYNTPGGSIESPEGDRPIADYGFDIEEDPACWQEPAEIDRSAEEIIALQQVSRSSAGLQYLGVNDISAQRFEQLQGVRAQLLLSLQDLDMSFEPLMPDDETPLPLRAEALGQWCGGFLLGFALAGQADTSPPSEITEILKDFAAIANVGVDAEDSEDNELAERDFQQLIEYVRVAVLTVYANYAAQLPGAKVGPVDGPQVH